MFAGRRRIVVYGAGRHGREIIDKVLESENHELVAVIDKNLVKKDRRAY